MFKGAPFFFRSLFNPNLSHAKTFIPAPRVVQPQATKVIVLKKFSICFNQVSWVIQKLESNWELALVQFVPMKMKLEKLKKQQANRRSLLSFMSLNFSQWWKIIKFDSKLIPMSSYFVRHHNILKTLLSMICNCTIEMPNACTIKNIISQLAISSMMHPKLKGFTDLSADPIGCPSANPVLLSCYFEHHFRIFQLHNQAEVSFNKTFFRLIEIPILYRKDIRSTFDFNWCIS